MTAWPVCLLSLLLSPAPQVGETAQVQPDEVTKSREGRDHGNAPSCGILASMYARGDGVPKDLEQAAALLQKMCDMMEAAA